MENKNVTKKQNVKMTGVSVIQIILETDIHHAKVSVVFNSISI